MDEYLKKEYIIRLRNYEQIINKLWRTLCDIKESLELLLPDMDESDRQNTLICSSCKRIVKRCDYCGVPFSEGDTVYEFRGIHLCEKCAVDSSTDEEIRKLNRALREGWIKKAIIQRKNQHF